MRAYELFQDGAAHFGRANIAPEQRKRISDGCSLRTVTSMLLTSTAAVLGENPAPRKKSLAAILNDFTRWHAA